MHMLQKLYVLYFYQKVIAIPFLHVFVWHFGLRLTFYVCVWFTGYCHLYVQHVQYRSELSEPKMCVLTGFKIKSELLVWICRLFSQGSFLAGCQEKCKFAAHFLQIPHVRIVFVESIVRYLFAFFQLWNVARDQNLPECKWRKYHFRVRENWF